MNKYFHNLILGVSILPALLIMPAIAADPVTEGYAWVFGDVTIPAGQPIDMMGFGGRRMSAHAQDGKYRNDFPAYNMLGQSLTVTAGNGESLSPLYVGPVNLTLKKLTDENFKYNYQWWNDEHNDPESDIDLAAAPAKLNLTAEQLAALGLESPLTSIGWNDEDAIAKVAAVIGAGNASSTAGGVVLFSHKDSDTTNDGVLSLGKTNAVIDGATVNAAAVNVTNSKLQFSKQDTTLFKDNKGIWYTSAWYTNAENISSDGITTLNANTINIDGSTLEVKPGAKLVINDNTPNGATTIQNVSSNYGALTANGNGSILLGGDSLVFDHNTSTSHGAALYFKDQTAGDNAARLIANNITFSNNTSDYSASSGGAVFSTGGNMSILGATNTFTGNKILGTDVAAKLHKRGGGAVANQSYEVEGVHTPIDADMVIGKENGSSTNIFTENTSSMNGGAIMNRAVDTDGNAYLTINGTTTFENNTATLNGGAIYNFADAGKVAEVNLTNGTYTFTENTAARGGAIYNSGIMNIANGEFVDNNATVTGGAVFSTGKLTVTDSLFDGNTADYGAAIRTVVNAPSTLTISGTTFRNNHANENGAVGIFDKSAESSITNSHFINNYTTFNDADAFAAMSVPNQNQMEGAGALSLGSESLVTISGTEFKNNYTTLGGGAISTRTTAQNNVGEKLDITNSTFIGNKAGVIYDATSDSVSASNFANIRGFGGAIYANVWNNKKGEGFATISDSTFTKNEAYNGGAIYNDAADGKVGNIKLTNSSFTSNIASENGGAIYNSGVLYLAGNNSFSGNTAATNGGAIYNEGDLYLAGINKFTGNTAAGKANDIYNFGALYVEGTTTLNGGTTGSGTLVVKDGATLNLGTASITQGQIDLQNGGTINATLDKDATSPLFNATYYTGQGTLKLAMAEIGTYHVFGGESFDIVSDMPWTINNADSGVAFANSKVYNLSWNHGDITAERKAVEDIASESGIAVETAAAVSNVIDSASNSSSKQMKDLSIALQEKLAEGDTEVVEHAAKAIHPEKEAVAQSVASSVQNTVVNLASSRMASPRMGRNGGDVKLTSGGFWFQGLFNKSKQNDAFTGNTRGIALGLDGTLNKRWTIGAGYSTSKSDITGTARDTKITSNTAFLYGQYKPAAWYLNAIANYTWSDYSEKGTIIDNRTIFGDYSVNSFGGALATGYDFKNGITPELGLRYMRVMASDYANSYGVKTHLDDANYLTGVLGGKYIFKVAATKHTVFMPQLNAGVKYDLLSDKNLATVTMPGVDSYTLEGKRLSRIGGEFGIGLGMQYHNLEISAIYDIDVRESYTSQTGMLKFRSNF